MKNKTLSQIVELLPEGLSQTGIEEICSLIEQTITEEVNAQQELLESKVTSFLNSKVKDLKEVARVQLEQEDSVLKEQVILDKIKTLALSLTPGEETSKELEERNDEIETLKSKVTSLNEMLEQGAEEKIETDKLFEEATTALRTLKEDYEELEASVQTTLISEITEMPRKGDTLLTEEEKVEFENEFITEEVVNLSKVI